MNSASRIPISCNICPYNWTPTIGSHVNGTGCPNCAGNAPWTLLRVITKSKEIHGDIFDYSLIKEEDIKGHKSRIPLICNTCFHYWTPTINDNINGKCGCPNCKGSRGEKMVAEILKNKLQIPYVREHIIPELSRKRYDFAFNAILNGIKTAWIVEYDGEQHFNYVSFFHKTENEFLERQNIDILKTKSALDAGYQIIRIDYTVTEYKSVLEHINRALYLNTKVYLSSKDLYQYMIPSIVDII